MTRSTYLQTPANVPQQPRAALFITCLADAMRPSIGFATAKLLQAAGCLVDVPKLQTCCGQPAYNSGDRGDTQKLARLNIKKFSSYDFVIGPSGSCIGMLHQYPDLFAVDSSDHKAAQDLASRAWEITSFLTDVMRYQQPPSNTKLQVTYHDSCAGLRELGIWQQPRQLLQQMGNVTLVEMHEANTCCGFGGTFCVKYPDISNRMVSNKTDNAEQTQAQLLLGGDLGCLMNMAGKLKRQGSHLQTRHIVEVLAGMIDTAAIAEADNTPLRAVGTKPKAELGYEV